MKTIPTRMTAEEFSVVLNITEDTVKKLARTKQLPCFRLKNRLYFDFDEIIKHFSQLEGGVA